MMWYKNMATFGGKSEDLKSVGLTPLLINNNKYVEIKIKTYSKKELLNFTIKGYLRRS